MSENPMRAGVGAARLPSRFDPNDDGWMPPADQPDSNVTVGVRVRSFRPSESRELAVRMAGPTCQITSEERGSLKFTYDQCFWSCDIEDAGAPYASQQHVYEALGKPIVQHLVDGFNCSLIAYGPTGSGKTYSLFGKSVSAAERPSATSDGIQSDDDSIDQPPLVSSPRTQKREEGLIIRVVEDVLHMQHASASPSVHESGSKSAKGRGSSSKMAQRPAWGLRRATCTMVEVYLDTVYDLFSDDRKELAVRADPQRKAYSIPSATEVEFRSLDEFRQRLSEAERRKTVMATAKNALSSRAHTIVQLSFEMEMEGEAHHVAVASDGENDEEAAPQRRVVRLGFADLAGSERIKEAKTEGLTLEQSRSINLSLLSLGKCVEAVAHLGKDANPNDIMHFKDCALTKLLKEFICGNSLTTLLVTIAPGLSEYHNTMHALRFGDRAKHITTHAAIQTNLAEAVQATNAILPVLVQGGDMGLADNGNGGRVYLFRQTKEYMQAQWTIRMFSLQKRESHLRHAISSEEHSAFIALQRHVGREISRAHASALRAELHKLPILLRLKRAIAITESEPVTSGSAPPALLDHSHSGNIRADVPRLNIPSSVPVVSLAARTARWARMAAGKRGDDGVTSPRSQREAWSERKADLASGATPRPPETEAASPVVRRSGSNNSRRNVEKEKGDGAPKGPALPSLFLRKPLDKSTPPESRGEGTKDHSKGQRPPEVLVEKKVVTSTPRKVSGNASEAQQTPRSSAPPAVVARLHPGSGKREAAVSPKPPPVASASPPVAQHRKSIAADAELLRRDQSAGRQQFLLAERQFNAEEYMKRVMVDTEQTSAWKRLLKDVVAKIPQHGTAQQHQEATDRRKSVAALMSRKSVVVSPTARRDSGTPTPSTVSASLSPSPVARSASSMTSPRPQGATAGPAVSPTWVPEPLTHSLSPHSDSPNGNSNSTEDTHRDSWSLHSPGPSRNRATSARFRQARIGSVDAEEETLRPGDVRVPTPPTGAGAGVFHRNTQNDAGKRGEQLCKLETDEVRVRMTIVDLEATYVRGVVALCAVHAALRTYNIANHFAQSLEKEATLADDDEPRLDHIPSSFVRQLIMGRADELNRGAQKRQHEDVVAKLFRLLSNPADSQNPQEVAQLCGSISWTWLLCHLELCFRAALTLSEDAAFQRISRHLVNRSSTPYEKSCLRACSSLKDSMACVILEVVRGMNILRHVSMNMGVASPTDLEVSLEPQHSATDNVTGREHVREGSILVPTGTSMFWNHRLSIDKFGARSRQRAVSFSEAAVSEDDDDVDSQPDVINSTLMPQNQEPPPSPPPAAMLPNGSSPVPSTPDSPRSQSSGSKSPQSTPSLSRSPSPTGKQEATAVVSNGSEPACEYDRIDYYPDPLTGVEPYIILDDVDRIEALKHEITRRNSSGVFTDEEQRHVRDREDAIDEVKKDMIDRILSNTVVTVSGDSSSDEDDAVAKFEDFFNDLVLSTDINPVNLKLVRALTDAWRQTRIEPRRISLLQLSERRGLVAAACVDGSFGYLRTLLNLYRVEPDSESQITDELDVNLDINEVVSSAMFNQLQRIPLVNTLLQYMSGDLARKWYPSLSRAFADGVQEMRHELNEFCNDICNAKKILPKENRSKRNELVHRIAQSAKEGTLPIDWMDEGADDQTRLSRSCRDGDDELLQLLIDVLPDDVVFPLVTRVQPDNMTALMHAVINGSKACVTILANAMKDALDARPVAETRMAVKTCLLHVSPDAGSALDLCRTLRRDVSIEVDIERLLGMVQ